LDPLAKDRLIGHLMLARDFLGEEQKVLVQKREELLPLAALCVTIGLLRVLGSNDGRP
jgi:hypothetical protein